MIGVYTLGADEFIAKPTMTAEIIFWAPICFYYNMPIAMITTRSIMF